MNAALYDAVEKNAAEEKSGALIRIVDDEDDVREALAMMLRIFVWLRIEGGDAKP